MIVIVCVFPFKFLSAKTQKCVGKCSCNLPQWQNSEVYFVTEVGAHFLKLLYTGSYEFLYTLFIGVTRKLFRAACDFGTYFSAWEGVRVCVFDIFPGGGGAGPLGGGPGPPGWGSRAPLVTPMPILTYSTGMCSFIKRLLKFYFYSFSPKMAQNIKICQFAENLFLLLSVWMSVGLKSKTLNKWL